MSVSVTQLLGSWYNVWENIFVVISAITDTAGSLEVMVMTWYHPLHILITNNRCRGDHTQNWVWPLITTSLSLPDQIHSESQAVSLGDWNYNICEICLNQFTRYAFHVLYVSLSNILILSIKHCHSASTFNYQVGLFVYLWQFWSYRFVAVSCTIWHSILLFISDMLSHESCQSRWRRCVVGGPLSSSQCPPISDHRKKIYIK